MKEKMLQWMMTNLCASCRKSATLQGEPISARIRGTEILSPWYPPGDKIWR